MTLGVVNLTNFDLTITSLQFGSIHLRNYGENGISAQIEALDLNLYNEKLGAFGDLMVNKNFKGVNKLLTFRILRNSPDYVKMQQIVAAEEAGQTILCTVNARDSLTEEEYISLQSVFKNIPNYQMGSDTDADVEYTILMSSTVHIPPKNDVIINSI